MALNLCGISFCNKLFTVLCYLIVVEVINQSVVQTTLAENDGNKDATVLIAILARNKAHTLPYFLTLLEKLDYPKNRISLWIRSDHNEDKTLEVLKKWLASVDGKYQSINSELLSSPPERVAGQKAQLHWSEERFTHVIQLKEEALDTARNMWADYIWFLDSDAFITHPETLRLLIKNGNTISAPMLLSDGLYSNFWCGMSEDFYYLRTDDYTPMINRKQTGCFHVPMVHTAVLIDLRKGATNGLTFVGSKIENYTGPHDDIIIFAMSANKSGLPLYVCNNHNYGYIMVPLADNDDPKLDFQQLINLKLKVLESDPPLPVSDLLAEYTSFPPKDKMGLDEVFMINLLRRPDRRDRMTNCFDELGLDTSVRNAVDGGLLNKEVLAERKIRTMPEYKDPYHKRPITMGEIGCFLSHYNIWVEVVQKGYDEVMVLEDDIQFEPFFRPRMTNMINELRTNQVDWDIVYLGRKRMDDKNEPFIANSEIVVEVGYSYWTLGYLLSKRGAEKLLASKPLDNLLPVDEFFPILYDKHPESAWKKHYPTRDLVALSAYPLLLFPVHYVGDSGYVSDTEDSSVAPPPKEDL